MSIVDVCEYVNIDGLIVEKKSIFMSSSGFFGDDMGYYGR
jgi:hypothetical protein